MEAIDTLVKYGTSYQTKVVASLVTDCKFLEQISEITNPSFFESDANKWIVTEIIDYFNEFRTCPTLEVFKIKVDSIEDRILKQTVVDQLRNIYQNIGAEDLPYVKKEFITFAKNQKIKEALLKSVDYLKTGQYEKIIDTMTAASKVGIENDLGIDYIEEFESIIEEVKRNSVPTGWDVVDDLMDGGLGPGELGVVMAPSGIGKSWFLSKIACSAAKAGLNVLHYTLELSENYVGQRYTTIITGIQTSEHSQRREEVIRKIKSVKGRVRIKYYPPRFASAKTLSAHIDKVRATGFNPDVIIIDYADLLNSADRSKDGLYAELGGIYEELRGLSGLVGCPIWTATQTNRCLTLDTEVDTPDGKIQIGDIKNGDIVLTHDGYKKVSYVFEREMQPVYRIKTKSGKEIKCSARHMFPTQYGKQKSIETGLNVGDKLFTKKS